MKILVTGGAGYIGSHICVSLIEAGYSVIIVDNLCNSSIENVDKIRELTGSNIPFYKIDITNELDFYQLFYRHDIYGIIHLAGLKSVGESTEIPLDYYYNNLLSTIIVGKACQKFKVKKLIFSSSATVYGDNKVPFVETMVPRNISNPYGQSKLISERILTDFTNLQMPNLSLTILRYFNPVGAHQSSKIGEKPKGVPNNLMPYITQVAQGRLEKLKIFGNDYPTKDGTGIRDYIHIMDLAEGHVAALKNSKVGVHIYNLGTGEGNSVLEVIQAFEEANRVQIPFEIVDRRPGDIACAYADVSKANKELGWNAKRDLISMCRDAWNFERKN